LLLGQSLGSPQIKEADTLLYKIEPPQLARHGNPTNLDQATISYDGAFSGPTIHRQGPSRKVSLREKTGAAATLALPLPGTRQIRGAIEGCGPNQIDFTLDDGPATPAWTAITDDLHTFEITEELSAGDHSLRFLPAAGAGCAETWVMNLTARLAALPLPASATPLARFVGPAGEQIDLLAAEIVSPPSPDPATGNPRLLTTWRTGASHALTRPGANPPTLYVHFEDAQGKRLAQSDHPVAADSYWLRDANGDQTTFVDVADLPGGEALAGDARVRVGLWYPDSQTYYWASESDRATADGRLDLGTVQQLKQQD
jgi:hypothetical protein